jgi:hypothetical protein
VPALPFVPGVAKVIVKQTNANIPIYNIFHVDGGSGTGWSSTELNSLASAVRSAWVTNVLPLQSTLLNLNDVTAIDLASETGPSGIATGTNAGGATGIQLPNNVAVCWSWAIARRYRGGHPRTYICGMTSTHVTNPTTMLSTYRTSHATAAAAFRTAVNAVTTSAGSAKLACVHYYKDKTLLATPLVSQITGVAVDDRFDSQRRRLGRDR